MYSENIAQKIQSNLDIHSDSYKKNKQSMLEKLQFIDDLLDGIAASDSKKLLNVINSNRKLQILRYCFRYRSRVFQSIQRCLKKKC